MIHILGGVRYDKVNMHSELDLASAYYISVSDGYLHKERFLDLSELIYVTEGTLYLSVDKKKIILEAGDIYAVRRYATISGNRASNGACSFYNVSFYCNLEKYEAIYGKIMKISSRASYAETLFDNMRLFSHKDRRERYLLDASLLLLLDILCDSLVKEPERTKINGILTYINDNISSSLTVEEISGHFHYCGDYMSKIFRQQVGMTLKQYVIERKLSAAKRLLSASDISLVKVGQSVGFEDVELFEKFFKYHIGTTPKKYRETHI